MQSSDTGFPDGVEEPEYMSWAHPSQIQKGQSKGKILYT